MEIDNEGILDGNTDITRYMTETQRDWARKLIKDYVQRGKTIHQLTKALEDICMHMRTIAPTFPPTIVEVIATRAINLTKDKQ